jgi:hypothetical protein
MEISFLTILWVVCSDFDDIITICTEFRPRRLQDLDLCGFNLKKYAKNSVYGNNPRNEGDIKERIQCVVSSASPVEF